MFNKKNEFFLLLKVDSEGIPQEIVDVGDTLCEILEYRKDELLSLSPSCLIFDNKNFLRLNNLKNIHFISSKNNKIKLQLDMLTLTDNQYNYVVLYKHKISEMQYLERDLDKLYAYYQSFFEHNPESIFMIDMFGKFIRHNQLTERLLAVESKILDASTLFDFIKKDQVKKIDYKIKNAFSNGKGITCETTIITKIGQEIPIFLKIIPILLGENVIGAYGILRDISREKRIENKIKQLAFKDEITNLPNKKSFLYQLKEKCKQVPHLTNSLAVILLQINGYTHLKDLFGEEFLGKMMKSLADIMTQSIKLNCFVSRIDDDTFGIIFTNYKKENLIIQTEELLEFIPKTLVIDNQEIKVDFSSGIASYPDDGENTEALIKNSKYALLIAREEKLNFLQYDSEKSKQIRRKANIEKELFKAINENQFSLFYQPQYDVVKQKIVGAEALIRWFHPKLGSVSPADFIPIAEANGLIIDIGKWVIEEGCEQLKKWHDQGYKDLKLSLNLSVRQLYQHNIVEMIDHRMTQLNLTSNSLVIELTESSMMQDIDHFNHVITNLKARGFQISIDDFGTGYSSLYYLTKLKIDAIKIDHSFIQSMEYSEENKTVVKTIISLAKNLHLDFIAEGVESYKQLTMLMEMECELIQGFYISKPIPAEEFDHLLNINSVSKVHF